MKILLNGINGHMGREVLALAARGVRSSEVVMGVDLTPDPTLDIPTYIALDELPPELDVDCIVDFSHHSCIGALLDFATSRGIPTVVATTGHTEEELAAIRAAAEQIPLFFSANMSLGVALLVELAKRAAAAFPEADIEIIEKHHNRKLDAPSGTALMLADALCTVRPDAYANTGRSGHGRRTREEIGIHAVRLGNVVGEHEVIISTASQTLTIKHEAHSRALFAEGALLAADFICDKEAGLYDMKSIIGGSREHAEASFT